MARRRNRFHKAELNNVLIGLIYLACGVNCLLGALMMHAREKAVFALLIGGGLAFVMACVWFFSNPFKSSRPLTTLNDVVTVAVVVLALNGMVIWKCWPLLFAVVLEAVLIIRFYRSNRPKRR